MEAVKSVVENGVTIKEYKDDTPYPSRLILGYYNNHPLHVVSAYNATDDSEYIITVYEPSKELWSDDFTKRRN